MAIQDLSAQSPRSSSRVLAELFDEAWARGRKRRVRAVMLLALMMAGAATVIITTSPGVTRSGLGRGRRTATGVYDVCATNVSGLWRYSYGTAACTVTGKAGRGTYSYHNLIVPAGARVALTIARSRSAHAVRIAALGLTIDASTGAAVRKTFRAPRRDATYSGRCLSGCRDDPTFAGASVIVMAPVRVKRWVAARRLQIADQASQLGEVRAALRRDGVLARDSSA